MLIVKELTLRRAPARLTFEPSMLKISVRNRFTLAAILVRMHAHDGEHLFCLNIFVCLSVVSKQTQFVIVHVCGPWPAYGNRQCKAAAKRKGNPTQCLSTNCVFAVFLLGAQCNKVPFAVYCSVLMCSVGAQNFKACCRVTFFLSHWSLSGQAKGRASFQNETV